MRLFTLFVLATIIPFQQGLAEPGADVNEPRLFVCSRAEHIFSVDEVPGFAVPEGPLPDSACVRLVSKDGAELAVVTTTDGSVAKLLEGEETRQKVVKPQLEVRSGDPISLGGRAVQVRKFFGTVVDSTESPFVTVAWVDSGTGTVVGFALRAPNREAHDGAYQQWRTFVRSYRPIQVPRNPVH